MPNYQIKEQTLSRNKFYTSRWFQKLDRGLLIADLDWTIVKPKGGANFINNPREQELIGDVAQYLGALNHLGYSVYLTSNQGGIKAGYFTREIAIAKMRFVLNLCPFIQRIYFSVDDEEVWAVTRNCTWFDKLPLNINTPSRYVIYGGPKHWLGGFRKPRPGMLRLALLDWLIKFPANQIKDNKPQNLYFCFYVGDRPEDEQAAKAARIPFLPADQFHQGIVLRATNSL